MKAYQNFHTDNLNPSNNKTYTYDNLYRLDIATGPWGTLDYGYDNVGNRTNETTATGNTSYTYNANKLASTTGEKTFSFSYDDNGNTTGENTKQYIYNNTKRKGKGKGVRSLILLFYFKYV